MYRPKHFDIDGRARLLSLIEDNALAMVMTVVDGQPSALDSLHTDNARRTAATMRVLMRDSEPQP